MRELAQGQLPVRKHAALCRAQANSDKKDLTTYVTTCRDDFAIGETTPDNYPDSATTRSTLSPSVAVPPRARGRGFARASSPDGFYGWRIVGLSAVALAATAPGQTAAVSAFIDPMINDLGVSRSQVSMTYLIGTLLGAAAMPTVGRALDQYGVRLTMAIIGALFGAVLLALSVVSGLVGLSAGFVGIRMLGQGALGLTATTAAAMWFTRRRGFALGLVSACGAVGISSAPLLLERLIAACGWRTAWAIEGLVVWAVVLPVALLGMRDRPSQLGQLPEGESRAANSVYREWGTPRRTAMRTPFFWVVTAGVGTAAMLGTGVAFHQISLLGERGLSATEAAANFLPQTVAALGATLATGALADRFSPRWLTVASMLILAAGLLWGAHVTPGLSAVGFGLLMGSAGGSIRSLEAAAFPRYFGTMHLGSIRGFVMAVAVGSSAFGPLGFALVREATGSYLPALLGSAVLPLVVAAVAALIQPPDDTRPSAVDRPPGVSRIRRGDHV